MRFLSILLFSLIGFTLNAQNLSGFVSNKDGERLEFAVVFIENTKLSATSDASGFYSIADVPKGQHTISCSYLGYETLKKQITFSDDMQINFIMLGEIYQLHEVEITSNKNKITHFPAGSNLNKEKLAKENLGLDIPALLQWQPSVIHTSDAGAGIGYTSMRIRGVDQSRINVTINDIPINDAESQGVFWVNMPDFTSSVENVKIQRGVGPSTNGAGAYGGAVSFNTFGVAVKPSIETNVSLGSFNTNRYNVKLNSGLLNNQYNVEARYSKINSDGFMDRASADLTSYYFEAAKVSSKSSLRFITFSGKEKTYQAWNGVPQAKVEGNRDALRSHYNNNIGTLYLNSADSLNLFNSDRRYNYYTYENQVDNYNQDHYQLHWAKNISSKLTAKTSLHFTNGNGYFEEYKYQDDFANYGLPAFIKDGDTISNGNVIRRRWLDNIYYGLVGKAEYSFSSKSLLSVGGAYNIYDGDHFGTIVSIDSIPRTFFAQKYYDGRGLKKDGNIYIRHESEIFNKIMYSIDLQYRNVDYTVSGTDNKLQSVNIDKVYNFFNPKLSLNYIFDSKKSIIASFAVANREPDRSDFLDNPKNKLPVHESLYDTEFGYIYEGSKSKLEVNAYYMNYKNQLIVTGELNDVGNNLRTNVPSSYRLGLETNALFSISPKWYWQVNATISKNKIKSFNEIIYDYTNGFDIITNKFTNTDIAFSPNFVASNVIGFKPKNNFDVALSTKYIGQQYMDNTMSKDRNLAAYTYTNLRVQYSPTLKHTKAFGLSFQINNLFNSLYSNNGYTYSYKYNSLITENFLYPQAGINFLIGLSIKL